MSPFRHKLGSAIVFDVYLSVHKATATHVPAEGG